MMQACREYRGVDPTLFGWGSTVKIRRSGEP